MGTKRTHRRGVLSAALLLLASLAVVLGVQSPSHALLLANRILITQVTTPGVTVPTTAGTPGAYVVEDTPFNVTVQFQDALFNPAPLSLSSTKLVVTATTGPDAGQVLGRATAPALSNGMTITGLVIPDPATGVTIRVAVDGSSPSATPGTKTFNVDEQVQTAPASTTLLSVGGDNDGIQKSCTATKAEPICIDMVLPFGATTQELLSLGPCDPTFGCPAERDTGTWLAGLDHTKYTRTAPGLLVVKCDKTSCPGTGVPHFNLTVQLTPTSPVVVAPPCAVRGQVGPDQSFCHDVAQDHRDNAGDVLLNLLWLDDGRISIPK
jgi:hypothetical protein